jgi:hypothetical protein
MGALPPRRRSLVIVDLEQPVFYWFAYDATLRLEAAAFRLHPKKRPLAHAEDRGDDVDISKRQGRQRGDLRARDGNGCEVLEVALAPRDRERLTCSGSRGEGFGRGIPPQS